MEFKAFIAFLVSFLVYNINTDMSSLACSNLFGEMSKRGNLKDLCREEHYMKIGTEERTECKHVE
jgi:hypothetical protein